MCNIVMSTAAAECCMQVAESKLAAASSCEATPSMNSPSFGNSSIAARALTSSKPLRNLYRALTEQDVAQVNRRMPSLPESQAWSAVPLQPQAQAQHDTGATTRRHVSLACKSSPCSGFVSLFRFKICRSAPLTSRLRDSNPCSRLKPLLQGAAPSGFAIWQAYTHARSNGMLDHAYDKSMSGQALAVLT